MRLRAVFTLLAILFVAWAVWIASVVYRNQIDIVDIADWEESRRELHLAAIMPSCACLAMTPIGDLSTGARPWSLWDRVRSLEIDLGEKVPYEDIHLVAWLNDAGQPIGMRRLRADETFWTFAFDWAGSQLGDHYQVQAFRDANGSPDFAAGPLEIDEYFRLDASPQRSCAEVTCPFDTLQLNRALGEHVGQDTVATTFSGVRVARNDHVIELQATGRARGAPGNCGCTLLHVLQPVSLRGTLNGRDVGSLRFEQPALVRVPFDDGGPQGTDYYTLTVEGGDVVITDYVRVLGQLDGMTCGPTEAVFAFEVQPAGQAVPGAGTTAPTLIPPPQAPASLAGGAGAQEKTAIPPELMSALRCPYTSEYGNLDLVQVANKGESMPAGLDGRQVPTGQQGGAPMPADSPDDGSAQKAGGQQ